MHMNRLGHTGLFVSELCLGTMTFGGGGGMWSAMGALPLEGAQPLFRAAHEAGINFYDTADVYSSGLSEEITGQALKGLGLKRDEYVLATKAFGQMGEGVNQRGTSRYHLMEACKASLKRLDLDHIDLYQIHGTDAATPIEEMLEAMDTLVRHGHVRYIGLSNWAAWRIQKALGLAALHQLTKPVSLQAYYTIAGRDLEREVAPMLLSEGLGLMVWSPLAGGLLSGKYSDGGGSDDDRRKKFEFPPVDLARADKVIAAMRPVAEAHGVSVAQIAISWLLHQKVVSSVIVGAKRIDQLADNIAATKVELSADQLAALNEASALPPEYPGWMIEFQGKGRRDALAAQRHPVQG